MASSHDASNVPNGIALLTPDQALYRANAFGFKIGDTVVTIKGAPFWGLIIGFDCDPNLAGATVMAIEPTFKGIKHVYPLKQLGHKVI